MKNSKTVLMILALSFGSFCGASLQASPENPLIKNTISLETFEPALDRKINYQKPNDLDIVERLLDGYPEAWYDLSLVGKARFFEYCPSDKLEFFQSLGDAEKVVALRYYDPTYHKDFLTYWDEANDNVRGAVFHTVKGSAAFKYELWKTLRPEERARNFGSLVCQMDSKPFLWEAWDLFDTRAKAEEFENFAKGCRCGFIQIGLQSSGPSSTAMPLEGATMIWDGWAQLSDDAKANNLNSLCYCLYDARRSAKDNSDLKMAYDQDMRGIAYNYDYLYEKGYGTRIDEYGDEESLFSYLPYDVKVLLFKPFLSEREGNKESAKWDFIEAYKLNEDEEDLKFIDDIKEDPDA